MLVGALQEDAVEREPERKRAPRRRDVLVAHVHVADGHLQVVDHLRHHLLDERVALLLNHPSLLVFLVLLHHLVLLELALLLVDLLLALGLGIVHKVLLRRDDDEHVFEHRHDGLGREALPRDAEHKGPDRPPLRRDGEVQPLERVRRDFQVLQRNVAAPNRNVQLLFVDPKHVLAQDLAEHVGDKALKHCNLLVLALARLFFV